MQVGEYYPIQALIYFNTYHVDFCGTTTNLLKILSTFCVLMIYVRVPMQVNFSGLYWQSWQCLLFHIRLPICQRDHDPLS